MIRTDNKRAGKRDIFPTAHFPTVEKTKNQDKKPAE
jgi:hypothetical protein